MNERARRQELADFLRTRRERLCPAVVGLPAGGRRRTPGLRREEVAQLAGVGLTWYTWLEQGRNIRVSPQVLDGIARALCLEPDERMHLVQLAGPDPMQGTPPASETVNPALQLVLDSLVASVAYIVGRRWDVLAWNAAAAAVFGDFATMTPRERNTLWRLFLREETRRLVVEWEAHAQRLLAQFRASTAPYAGDPWFRALIAELERASPEFRAWWPRHDVLGSLEGRVTLAHPDEGPLALQYTTFQVHDAPDLKLIVYTPLPGTGSAARIARLGQRSTGAAAVLTDARPESRLPQRDSGPPAGGERGAM